MVYALEKLLSTCSNTYQVIEHEIFKSISNTEILMLPKQLRTSRVHVPSAADEIRETSLRRLQ